MPWRRSDTHRGTGERSGRRRCLIPFQTESGAFPIHAVTRLLIAAYLIASGVVLTMTPWSPFWLHNYFAQAWPWLGDAMATTAVRGAVTGVGLVTALAGVLDLVSVLIARRAAVSPSSITPADGPRP